MAAIAKPRMPSMVIYDHWSHVTMLLNSFVFSKSVSPI
jgi:hypothetical protein